MDPNSRPEGRLADDAAVATPSGYVLPDIDAMMAEVGATYALMGYSAQADADDPFGDREALDAVIFAGLIAG